MAFDIFCSMGVAASRTAHVWLTINDGSKVRGVYNNVEHVDEAVVTQGLGLVGEDTRR